MHHSALCVFEINCVFRQANTCMFHENVTNVQQNNVLILSLQLFSKINLVFSS